MGLSLTKSNLIFLKKCLDKWVHFTAIIGSEKRSSFLKIEPSVQFISFKIFPPDHTD